ncbi:uncharacterized protein MYCFIDRAFT_205649 [Pseudocercospora fijiensis CIRAD86]|uniref:Uncharacterized protein n=1 Tax=Pseudocercospora fijiensis (strain CIRAD86) TaxID=383855 RepID=N1Q5R6_PSEFD|nr:uncharacterized protein MYCFIDRAFT_205649 [Pseudocercospora fijiensis CIRAD86]EME87360.1 hypothetical protein MYCFIDRAFT_205649 [Pseudocercospora fijiensis CIRAD86]
MQVGRMKCGCAAEVSSSAALRDPKENEVQKTPLAYQGTLSGYTSSGVVVWGLGVLVRAGVGWAYIKDAAAINTIIAITGTHRDGFGGEVWLSCELSRLASPAPDIKHHFKPLHPDVEIAWGSHRHHATIFLGLLSTLAELTRERRSHIEAGRGSLLALLLERRAEEKQECLEEKLSLSVASVSSEDGMANQTCIQQRDRDYMFVCSAARLFIATPCTCSNRLTPYQVQQKEDSLCGLKFRSLKRATASCTHIADGMGRRALSAQNNCLSGTTQPFGTPKDTLQLMQSTQKYQAVAGNHDMQQHSPARDSKSAFSQSCSATLLPSPSLSRPERSQGSARKWALFNNLGLAIQARVGDVQQFEEMVVFQVCYAPAPGNADQMYRIMARLSL